MNKNIQAKKELEKLMLHYIHRDTKLPYVKYENERYDIADYLDYCWYKAVKSYPALRVEGNTPCDYINNIKGTYRDVESKLLEIAEQVIYELSGSREQLHKNTLSSVSIQDLYKVAHNVGRDLYGGNTQELDNFRYELEQLQPAYEKKLPAWKQAVVDLIEEVEEEEVLLPEDEEDLLLV